MQQVDIFGKWHKNRHEYAREWKARTGGKVIGYFCTYVPEEIIYAAGALPVRILGSHEPQDITEPHIFGMFCPFCRDCLAQGLQGRYDYLDGIMISQSCLHIRNAFSSWKLHVPTEYSYYLPMPNNVQSPSSRPYLYGELLAFKESLENWIGKGITEGALRAAIDAYNTNRQLMKKAYETRRAENPPITGLEAMEMVVSSQMTDKAEHNRALEELLESLPDRKLDRAAGFRLMAVGSEDDDTEFVKMVESVGATIVTDEHCTGTRYFWNQVEPDDDPLRAIANRYIDRVPCPCKDYPDRRRFDQVFDLIDDYRVQGVLLLQQKFCDPHECDIPPLTWKLDEKGIRSLMLELDVTVPIGQFRTRVEAFLETLSEEDLF